MPSEGVPHGVAVPAPEKLRQPILGKPRCQLIVLRSPLLRCCRASDPSHARDNDTLSKAGPGTTQICLRPCSQVKDLGCRVRVIIIKILYRTTPRLLYDKSWVPYKMRAYQGKILCYSMVYIKL